MGLKLGAAYIIKGSVERVLDRVRVSVVLIDAEKELQTWAGSFDRALTATNWFDIRNEISRVIANTLQAELSPQEQQKLETVPTENLAALQAYFHGKQRMAKRTTKPLAEAVGYFQQAVELDPNFALAHVGLAESSYLHMLYSSLAEDEWFPRVEAAIETALELDDQLGEAYAIRGVIQWMKYDDPLAADMAYQRALELNPNYATTHQWYGTFLSNQGRTEEALAQRRKAQELDPLSAIINLVTGNTLRDLGRFDEALAVYKTVIEIDPAFANAYERIGEIHRYVFGQLDEAVVWQRKGISLDPGEPWGSIFLGFIYLDLGDPDRAEYWFKRAQKLAPPGNPMLSAIMEPLYLFRGDEVKALDQARNTLTFNPTAEYSLAHLRNHDLQAGRNAEARDRYEQAYPALFGADELAIDDDNFVPAIDLALVLTRTGEQERAKLLLDRSLAFIRTTPRLGMNGYGISDVLIYALQGKTGMALAALREAVDQGWRGNWWFYLKHDPGLDSIRGEPEFRQALEEIRADMAAQLERVRTLEANGELAPIQDI
jgi:tetratricopeptide (TPR) repeat protein